jgi:hypothetical protein
MKVALLKKTFDVVIDPPVIDDSILVLITNVEDVDAFAQELADAEDKANFVLKCKYPVYFNNGIPPTWTMGDVKANKEKRIK